MTPDEELFSLSSKGAGRPKKGRNQGGRWSVGADIINDNASSPSLFPSPPSLPDSFLLFAGQHSEGRWGFVAGENEMCVAFRIWLFFFLFSPDGSAQRDRAFGSGPLPVWSGLMPSLVCQPLVHCSCVFRGR